MHQPSRSMGGYTDLRTKKNRQKNVFCVRQLIVTVRAKPTWNENS